MDLNIGYFFIIHGLLLVGEFLLSMIVVICIGVAHGYYREDGVVYFTSIGSMITSFIFIIINLLNIPNNATNLPWMLIRFVISAFWALFYFVSLWICVAGASKAYIIGSEPAYTASAVFSAVALIVYAWDAIINFFKLRRGPSAQQTS